MDTTALNRLCSTVEAARESGSLGVDSPGKDTTLDSGMPDEPLLEFGEPENMTIDAIENSNNTTTGIAAGSHHTTAHKVSDSENVPNVPDEAIAMNILGTAKPDTTILNHDMMKSNIPEAKNSAQQEANALCTMSQYHHPPSCEGPDSWQVVNLSTIHPKELLQSWNWVFHRDHN